MATNKKEVPSKYQFTAEELKAVNDLHALHDRQWLFFQSMYNGIPDLIKNDFLVRHERESEKNWLKRQNDFYSFDYSQAIIDLFNFYQFKDPTTRKVPDKLKNDVQWQSFNEDANLYGDNLDDTMKEYGRKSQIYGHIGILVDKSSQTFENKADEKAANVYPYLCMYTPRAILDWRIDKDDNNRPFLGYLKLLDDNDQYRIWYQDQWEIWEIQPVSAEEKLKNQGKTTTPDEKAVMIASGINPLDEIPFFWLYNVKSLKRFIGTSDIKSISYIDLSIIRNLSQGEEVIEYAAFPMMRKPMKEVGSGESTDDTVGVKAVLEFDPEHPESKPDWLEARTKDAIDSVLEWIAKKVSEIYRSSNAGGMASTEIQTQAKSGVALRTEFQLLNSKLVDKGLSLQKAEKRMIRYWLMWQDLEDLNKDVEVNAPKSYDVDNLAQELEDILTSRTIVKSKEFHVRLQKDVVRKMYPYLEDEEYAIIDKEIEDNTPDPMDILDALNNTGNPDDNIDDNSSQGDGDGDGE